LGLGAVAGWDPVVGHWILGRRSCPKSFPRFVARPLFFGEPFNQLAEIWIARAKLPREPIPPACRYLLAVRNNVELTGLTRRVYNFDIQALFDQGRETRDLRSIVVSSRAVHDFNLHPVPHTPVDIR